MNDLTRDEIEIRAAIEDRIASIRAKDVDRLMSGYAPDVATFDMVEPLANNGADAVRARVVQWFGSFATPIDYELRGLHLAAADDIAFDHHFTRVRGTNHTGEKVDMWFRETIGYRKLDGHWRVVHQHSSVPFDMVSGKARIDLQP